MAVTSAVEIRVRLSAVEWCPVGRGIGGGRWRGRQHGGQCCRPTNAASEFETDAM